MIKNYIDSRYRRYTWISIRYSQHLYSVIQAEIIDMIVFRHDCENSQELSHQLGSPRDLGRIEIQAMSFTTQITTTNCRNIASWTCSYSEHPSLCTFPSFLSSTSQNAISTEYNRGNYKPTESQDNTLDRPCARAAVTSVTLVRGTATLVRPIPVDRHRVFDSCHCFARLKDWMIIS